ncbi:hypothetical protein LAUMK22_04155 [Mycobacterium kansasii]|nr:hypothetical protein LAUMK22_04155 [Mycobacterium kansasii]
MTATGIDGYREFLARREAHPVRSALKMWRPSGCM